MTNRFHENSDLRLGWNHETAIGWRSKNGKGWFFDLWIKQHSFLKFHFFSMLSQCALCNSNCPLKMTTVDRPKLLCNFEQTLPKENRLFIANIILAHSCNWCIVEFGLSKCFIYYSETWELRCMHCALTCIRLSSSLKA